MNVSWFWKHAGLVTVWRNRWAIHLFPSYSSWCWGLDSFWFEGDVDMFGLGPLLLVTWDDSEDPS